MKKLLIILAIFLLPAIALAARFDFTSGEPAVVGDPTNGATTDFSTRYENKAGEPSIVFDATAVAPSTSAVTAPDRTRLNVSSGQVIIRGQIIIQ